MKLYRSMIEESDGLPRVGQSGRMLGVRPAGTPAPDVLVADAKDLVRPGEGGMSVAPADANMLPKHRRPGSLGGTGADPVWYIEMDDLSSELSFRQDSPKHGVIEPAHPMILQQYQGALERSSRLEVVFPVEISMMAPKERFDVAQRSSEPGSALRAAVLELAAEGWQKDQLYEVLEEYLLSLRASKHQRLSEDTVLDAMDALDGWCHPNAQLLP